MTRIALCLFNYFPFGGLQKNFITIAHALVEQGHEVHVYTADWQAEPPKKLELHVLPVTGFFEKFTNANKNKTFVKKLHKALDKQPFDLIFGFNKMPGLDLYYCADTCFATKAYEQRGVLYRTTARARQSLSYEQAVFGSEANTDILLLSAKEGEAFQKYYATPDERLHLVPPGIARDRVRNELSEAKGNALRGQLGIAPEHKVICFIGAYFKTKGLDRLLEATAKLSESQRNQTQLIIVGNDKRLANYQRQAQDLGIAQHCHFLGQRSDIPDCLFASDLLVHPARVENTGNVLLEAAVAGVPVITTDVCGYADYITDNQLGKVLESPFDIDALASSISELLEDNQTNWPERSAKFVENCDVFSRLEFIVNQVQECLSNDTNKSKVAE